ncbi:hypothetical protein [Actinacidiphila oryziradicis]|uniref:hypothetical protein n=1 Tax=Actinacidiphila oryziradicis TaxID=2571141 RepID=UPI001FE8B8B4|nr:hypothetical protein [Actinacidiphila oryziradicis]
MKLLRGAAMTASALLIATLVATGLLTHSSWSDIRDHSAPPVTSATGLYFTLNDMDAQLANQLMLGTTPNLAADRRTAARVYTGRRTEAAARLRDLAEAAQGDPTAEKTVARAIADFGMYEESAARALLLSDQAGRLAGKTDPGALAAYRSATELMRTRLLPEADQLVAANNNAFNTTYSATTDKLSSARIAVLAAGLLLLTVLVVLQVFLTARFHRIVNPALAAASLIVLGVLITATMQISGQQEHLRVARHDAFDSVVALTRARAVAYDANADESRYLLDQLHAAEHQQDFFTKSQQLMRLPSATITDYDAWAGAAMTAYRTDHQDLRFTGYFGDEFRNITFSGERLAAEEVVARYRTYQQDDRHLRSLAASGHLTAAIQYCVSYRPDASNADFAQYDKALQKLIAINTDAYQQAAAEGANSSLSVPLGLAAAAAALAALAVIGLRPRLAEFR